MFFDLGNFHNPQMNMNINNNMYNKVNANFMMVQGCMVMEITDNNFSSEADRDLLLESNLMCLDLENHLGPFLQLSDEHEHQ